MSRRHRKYILLGVAVGGSVFLAVVASWMIQAFDGEPVPMQEASAPQCGHWVILRSCQLLGVPVEMQTILQLLPPRDSGASMLELRNTLKRIGLKATGKRQTTAQLAQGPFPVIAHLSAGHARADHYVTVSSADEKTVRVFDDSGRAKTIAASEFEKMWDGALLSIERAREGQPLPRLINRSRKGRPCIEFDTVMVDKGDVAWHGEPLACEFPVYNTGEAPLVIANVKTDCGCLGAEWPRDPIAPGGKGVIVLRYSLRTGQGPFKHEALVRSNDPSVPLIVLTTAGNTDAKVRVTPEYVYLGQMSPGQTQTALLSIHYTGEGPFEIRDTLSEKRQVRVDDVVLSQGSTGEFMYGQRAEQQRVYIRPNTHVLRITYQAQARDVNDTAIDTVIIHTGIDRFREIRIPVVAQVLPRVGLYPSLLPFRTTEFAEATVRNVEVISRDGTPMRIISVNAEGAGIEHAATPGFAKHHTLTLSAPRAAFLSLAGKSLDIEVELQGTSREMCRLTLPICAN